MLKTIKLENFIHFKDKHKLNFEKGAHFMVGENNTGKSSVFEAIRRCMSASRSNGTSSSHDPAKVAYVMCTFEDTEIKERVVSAIVNVPPASPTGKTDGLSEEVLYRRVVLPFDNVTQTSCTGNTDRLSVKVVYTCNSASEPLAEVYSDAVKTNKNGKLVKIPLDGLIEVNEVVDAAFPYNIVDKLQHNDQINEFLIKENIGTYQRDTQCEYVLKSKVDKFVVIIYPFRGFSPHQSSETEQKQEQSSSSIAKKVSWKADVLRRFLSENDKITPDERRREEEYFNIITSDSGFQFEIDDRGVISIRNQKLRKRHLDATPLLYKIPEGIYEAKVLSVLLALTRYKTVCIDDAERGMHPQMIERVRDFVLRETDKVVLLITHCPVFLTRWNIMETFLFQRINEGNNAWMVTYLKDECQKEDNMSMTVKTLQIMADHSNSSIFFAKSILFVDGKSDDLFMSNVFWHLIQKPDLLRKFISQDEKGTIDEIKYYLSSFSIVQMGGAPNAYKFHHVCQTLRLKHYLLLDYDTVSNNIPSGTKKDGTDKERFCSAMNIDYSPEKEEKDVESFEDDGIFIWKQHKNERGRSGRIEDVVVELFKEAGQLTSCRLLDRNKKLFLDKDISYEDIQTLVLGCLELAAEQPRSDINRLVKFFLKAFQRRGLGKTF